MGSLLPLTQPSVSSPTSSQSHLLTLKTLQWFPISLEGKGTAFPKSQVVLLSADSLTSPPTLSQLQPHWPPSCPSGPLAMLLLALHFGSLCAGTLLLSYPHYLLPHFLRAFLKCHLLGKALITCSSILPILLSLSFLQSTDPHRKQCLSVCLPLQEKVDKGGALFCSLIESQCPEEWLVQNRN